MGKGDELYEKHLETFGRRIESVIGSVERSRSTSSGFLSPWFLSMSEYMKNRKAYKDADKRNGYLLDVTFDPS